MKFSVLLAVYLPLLAIEIFANAARNTGLQYFSKPSLMLVLLFYYLVNARKLAAAKFPVIAALFFSWLGDVFLLVDKTRGSFFIYGLTAFLAAHIFYILYFRQIRKINQVRKRPGAFVLLGVAAYSAAFFAFLAPNVKDLLVPVAVYALAITLMLGASLSAFDFGRDDFGRICAAGSVLFVISDSVLAINRFVAPFAYAPALVMLSYGLAQLLIAEGSLRNLRNAEKRRPDDKESPSGRRFFSNFKSF